MSQLIAGILLYRKKPDLQLLLAHPGGPLSQEKDEKSWNIPQNYVDPNSHPFELSKAKFEESFGFIPEGDYIDLGTESVEDKEQMQVWAVNHDIPDSYIFEPYWFELEWPPDSGKVESFPEMDRIEYFGPFEAQKKVRPAQTPFITKLITSL